MSEPSATTRACPICGKPTTERYRPFCSARCGNVDLGRWLNEGYRIPADSDGDDRKAPDESRPEEDESPEGSA